jgi:ligand-binding sensor domain-containing protein
MNREYVYLAALLLYIAVLSSPGFTLDPSLDIHQYNLAVFTTNNGLPQNSVLTVLQTSDGFLWMGTYEGLARFDGLHFKIFDSSTTQEIISNRIRCILEA